MSGIHNQYREMQGERRRDREREGGKGETVREGGKGECGRRKQREQEKLREPGEIVTGKMGGGSETGNVPGKYKCRVSPFSKSIETTSGNELKQNNIS